MCYSAVVLFLLFIIVYENMPPRLINFISAVQVQTLSLFRSKTCPVTEDYFKFIKGCFRHQYHSDLVTVENFSLPLTLLYIKETGATTCSWLSIHPSVPILAHILSTPILVRVVVVPLVPIGLVTKVTFAWCPSCGIRGKERSR